MEGHDLCGCWWRGKLWCHLVADSLDELHAFAGALGLKRSWFQERAAYPHYDVTTEVRDRALRLGALQGRKAQIIASARLLRSELRGLQSMSPCQDQVHPVAEAT